MSRRAKKQIPSTPFRTLEKPGSYSARVEGWEADQPYEFRAVAKHPLLRFYGEAKRVTHGKNNPR